MPRKLAIPRGLFVTCNVIWALLGLIFWLSFATQLNEILKALSNSLAFTKNHIYLYACVEICIVFPLQYLLFYLALFTQKSSPNIAVRVALVIAPLPLLALWYDIREVYTVVDLFWQVIFVALQILMFLVIAGIVQPTTEKIHRAR